MRKAELKVLPETLELWDTSLITDVESKKLTNSSREMTTPLSLLRCLEAGIVIRNLDLLTIGMVLDIWTEKGNDEVKYKTVASMRIAVQEDFDCF